MHDVVLEISAESVLCRTCADREIGIPAFESLQAFRPAQRPKIKTIRLLNVVIALACPIKLRETIGSETHLQGAVVIGKREGSPVHALRRGLSPDGRSPSEQDGDGQRETHRALY